MGKPPTLPEQAADRAKEQIAKNFPAPAPPTVPAAQAITYFDPEQDWWQGPLPVKCSIDGYVPKKIFYWARTQTGTEFQIICPYCYKLRGVPLGRTGGYRFARDPAMGRFKCTTRYE